MEFIDKSDLVWNNLDSEEWREYEFNDGAKIKIVSPLKLNVSSSGGHRIFSADGLSHYVPSGWLHLIWKAKEGKPHFDF